MIIRDGGDDARESAADGLGVSSAVMGDGDVDDREPVVRINGDETLG